VIPNAKGDDLENFFLTRSLAAFVIVELAGVDDKIAAKAVVGGSKDNGLDAFYFDPTERVCYLIQSKWIHNGKGSIEVGEVHKFLQGSWATSRTKRLTPGLDRVLLRRRQV
jgi:hypothetical protein